MDAGVIGLSPATGEDKLARLAAQERGSLVASVLDGLLGFLPKAMRARGVAILRGEIRSIASSTAGATAVVALLSR